MSTTAISVTPIYASSALDPRTSSIKIMNTWSLATSLSQRRVRATQIEMKQTATVAKRPTALLSTSDRPRWGLMMTLKVRMRKMTMHPQCQRALRMIPQTTEGAGQTMMMMT